MYEIPKTFHLSIHDLAYSLPGLEELVRLKEHYPNLKITAFVIPEPNKEYCKELGVEQKTDIEGYKKWAKKINSYDWLECGIHGYGHVKRETKLSDGGTKDLLKRAEKKLDDVGLKYKKIYAAPYWQYSQRSLIALRDMGYTVAGKPSWSLNVYPIKSKVYCHDWTIDDPKLPMSEYIYAQGHITDYKVKDGINECFDNIVKNIPKDAKFKFISEITYMGGTIPDTIKLNLGGCPKRNPKPEPEFTNLDKKNGWVFQDGLPDYPDHSVNAITISHAIMFLTKDELHTFIKEAYRVLKVDGIIRITEDNTTDPNSPVFGGWMGRDNTPHFVSLTDAKMTREALESVKFKVYDVQPEETYYSDKSLIQQYHGTPPRVFHIEGIKYE